MRISRDLLLEKIIETFAKSHRVEENGCWIFSKACEHVKKNKNIKVWQNSYHAAYL
jgi:hypothetical protein